MKLTKEQATTAHEDYLAYSGGVKGWLETYEFPDSIWIWGGYRMPTKEEADAYGWVCIYEPLTKTVAYTAHTNPDIKSRFWTPTPRHLKKPEPPDAFQEWYRDFPYQSGVEVEDLLKSAFLAGQSSISK